MHYAYILASRPHGAIYVGSSGDLRRRLEWHRLGREGHTARYGIHTLVWFEPHACYADALSTERRLKRWRRAWKDELIAAANPHWRDVAQQLP